MISSDLIEQFCRERLCGVLATVLSVDGSGPAQQGDYLFWAGGKLLAGTVGGGANEQQVLKACADFSKKQQVVSIFSPPSGLLPSCGGKLEVRLNRLDLAKEEDIALLKKQQKGRGGNRLLLFGAGHVVQELAWLADRNRFSCVVVDPRRELMSNTNFPAGVSLICCSVDDYLQRSVVTADNYIVIAGPDHAVDLRILELVAITQAHYVGVMGSKRKIGSFIERLQKKSLLQLLDGRLFAPIGIGISSRRPSEVAVSIVAELISIRAALLKNNTDLCLK
jgi:xanthine dehydrogenase accessory factor